MSRTNPIVNTWIKVLIEIKQLHEQSLKELRNISASIKRSEQLPENYKVMLVQNFRKDYDMDQQIKEKGEIDFIHPFFNEIFEGEEREQAETRFEALMKRVKTLEEKVTSLQEFVKKL